MALPLPKVVADVEAGGPFVTAAKGMNSLKKLQSEAQYAPYTNYANALSKMAYAQYTPLDIQAKLMSNPALLMAIKDDPNALQALTSNTNFLMKRAQGNMGGQPGGQIDNGGFNLPSPGQIRGSNGLLPDVLGWLANKVMGGNNQGNALNAPVPESARPASTGVSPSNVSGNTGMFPSPGLGGYVDIKTAPMSEQLHKPGTSYIGPDGKVHSVASEPTVSSSQASILGVQRVTPQLERIASQAAPFLTLGGQGKLQFEKIKNLVGGKSQLPSQYEKFRSELESAPESLLKAYGLNATDETIKRMSKVIEPHFGESAAGYKDRILTTLQEINNDQQGTAEKALSEGITVSGGNKSSHDKNAWPMDKLARNESELEGQVPPHGTAWMIRPDGMKVPVHTSQQSIAKNKYHYRGI